MFGPIGCNTPFYRLRVIKAKYWSVWVGFLYMLVMSKLSASLVTDVPWKVMELSFSTFIGKWIVGCFFFFKCCNRPSKLVKVSSMYHFQISGLWGAVGIACPSNSIETHCLLWKILGHYLWLSEKRYQQASRSTRYSEKLGYKSTPDAWWP